MHLIGIVYVWIGGKADADDARMAEEVVQEGVLYDKEQFSMQVCKP